MTSSDVRNSRPQQVFISYAHEDRLVASQIANALRAASLQVWFDEWELASGDSIAKRIDDQIHAGDLLVVLLSPSSVKSKWVNDEWTAARPSDLQSRAVTVIPVLIADCTIPPMLKNLRFLDLRDDFEGGVQDLIQQIGLAPSIDFSKLNWSSFELLVSDLLSALGFSVERPSGHGAGFDFAATFEYKDPFGMPKREHWLVEVKLYKKQRVSLDTLSSMVLYLMTGEVSASGLVVTNGQLTSVATKYLREAALKSNREIRVIEGTELRALLLRYPHLVERYFPKAAGQ
jgi:hypothetical protein